jgi:hypothetical protein
MRLMHIVCNALGIFAAFVVCFVFSSCKETSPILPSEQDDTTAVDTSAINSGIDSFEIDDLPAQASSLNQQPAQVHRLKDSADIDWMKLKVGAGEVVSFMVTSKCPVILTIVSSVDFTDTVFTDNGLNIIYTHTFGRAVDLYAAVTAPAQAQHMPIAYSVLAYSDYAVGEDSFETNESPFNPVLLKTGGPGLVRWFNGRNDQDYFKAFLTGDSFYTIYFASPAPQYSIGIIAFHGKTLTNSQIYLDEYFNENQLSFRLFPDVTDTFCFMLQPYGTSSDTVLKYLIRLRADTLLYKADQFEPDNSLSFATLLLANGQEQHHTLHRPADSDFFVIALQKDSLYTCSFKSIYNTIELQIYDRTKTRKSTQRINYSTTMRFSQEINDTAYFRICPSLHDVGKYDLSLVAQKIPFFPDSFERDTKLSPVVITGSDTLKRTFHFADDSDFVLIKPPKTCFVRFSIGSDTTIAIENYFYSKNQFAPSTFYAYYSYSVNHPISSTTWSVFPDSGLLILSTMDRDLGQYTIAVSFVDSIPSRDVFEWDDRPSLADTMPVNGAARRYSIWPANDIDWILFQMSPDSVYTVALNTDSIDSRLSAKGYVLANSGILSPLSKTTRFGTPDTLQEQSLQSHIYGYQILNANTGYYNSPSSPAWYTIKITSRKRVY